MYRKEFYKLKEELEKYGHEEPSFNEEPLLYTKHSMDKPGPYNHVHVVLNKKEENLLNVQIPEKKPGYEGNYLYSFLKIFEVMKDLKIPMKYGEHSGYIYITEEGNCLRIMRGETNKKSKFYCSMVQFNNGPIYMIKEIRIIRESGLIEIMFKFLPKSGFFSIIITKDGWEMEGIPGINKDRIVETIKEVSNISTWVKLVRNEDDRVTIFNVNSNAYHYVLKNSSDPDEDVDEEINVNED